MRSFTRRVAALSAAALLLAACGGAEETEESAPAPAPAPAATEDAEEEAPALSGSIEIDGSSTVAPLTDAIAEEYAAVQPDVIVNLSVSGTGGGFERFCGTGDTQFSNASRPIKQSEAELCASNGIEFTEIRVGTDALTMVTSPDTPDTVACLTTDEVVKIFGPEGVDTWDQVNPAFPNVAISIYAPDTDSGTYDFMLSDILDIEESRQDYNSSADDNIISQGVSGTPGSWGFFGFAYYINNTDAFTALEYDGGDGCVAPSVETAQDGTYLATRPLFVYVRNDALEDPAVADFATFYLETVNDVIGEVGYIPATDAELAEARAAVAAAIG
ncbi:MAG: PstS family phosphate ABC transporter substrate-binding protein [Nitriliruptoraceae bacterium]